MAKEIRARVKSMSDTKAGWEANNPAPLFGEICNEIDTGRQKIGDGATPWNGLPYTNGNVLFYDAPAPPDDFGSVGQLCVCRNGTYKKTQKEIFDLQLASVNPALTGLWINQGVNPSTVYNAQGSDYYLHESGTNVCSWNEGYGGYEWISQFYDGDVLTALGLANGQSYAYRYTPTFTAIPPNDNWSGAMGDSPVWTAVNYRTVERWIPFQLFRAGDDGHMSVNGERIPLLNEVIADISNSSTISGYTEIINGKKVFIPDVAISASAGNVLRDNGGLFAEAESTATSVYNNGANASYLWNIIYPVVLLTSSLASGTLTINKTGTVKSGFSRWKLLINNTNAAGTSKGLSWGWPITWDKTPLTTLAGGAKYAFELWTFDGGSNWFGSWGILNNSDYYVSEEKAEQEYLTKSEAADLYAPKGEGGGSQPGTPNEGYFDDEGNFVFEDEKFVFTFKRRTEGRPPNMWREWALMARSVSGYVDAEAVVEIIDPLTSVTWDTNIVRAEISPIGISDEIDTVLIAYTDFRKLKCAMAYYDDDIGSLVPYIVIEIYIFGDPDADNVNFSFKHEYLNARSFNEGAQDG